MPRIAVVDRIQGQYFREDHRYFLHRFLAVTAELGSMADPKGRIRAVGELVTRTTSLLFARTVAEAILAHTAVVVSVDIEELVGRRLEFELGSAGCSDADDSLPISCGPLFSFSACS